MRKMFVLMLLACVPAMAADVAVSVAIGEPGFYGRIDIGTFPQPRVIISTPVVIQAIPVGVVRGPLYLRVPPGHEKKWAKHCAEYNACGSPVYFVEDGWYNTVYAPAYKAKHGRPEHSGKGNGGGNSAGTAIATAPLSPILARKRRSRLAETSRSRPTSPAFLPIQYVMVAPVTDPAVARSG